jgi:hypothetical protein
LNGYFIDKVFVVELKYDVILLSELEVVDGRHDHDFGNGDLFNPAF